jgi:ribosomal protein S18 acetylase RimI-like enzyme
MEPTLSHSANMVSNIIRPVTEHDMPAFHALRLAGLLAHPEAFGETAEHFKTISTNQLTARLRASEARGGCILGAFSSDGALVGVVGLGRQEGEKMEHRAILWGMYVAPVARGKGVGKSLISACLERAAKVAGLEQVHLSVVTSNKAAVELYKTFGFQIYGTDPGVLKVGATLFDEYLMVRHLKDIGAAN